MIEITTYPGTDEDIYAAENYYVSLETALNQQINEMERRHPNYDEYQYNIAEIGHNPYHLISYLTAKYGDWTYSDVENELQALFEAQYHLEYRRSNRNGDRNQKCSSRKNHWDR